MLLLGPVPTPAVAMLTRSMRCDLGVMISASHNPYEDGIKLFGPDGYKLSDEVEARIESLMDGDVAPMLARSPDLGELRGKVGDGVNQAADLISATTSIPSLNFIPLTTFGNWFFDLSNAARSWTRPSPV